MLKIIPNILSEEIMINLENIEIGQPVYYYSSSTKSIDEYIKIREDTLRKEDGTILSNISKHIPWISQKLYTKRDYLLIDVFKKKLNEINEQINDLNDELKYIHDERDTLIAENQILLDKYPEMFV